MVNYEPGDTTSIFLNLRVADIQACYEEWKSKGAEFVTPPIDREAEIRCYMRDPDGYMIEVGQATGALHGHLAKSARRTSPAELPGCNLAPVTVVNKLGSRSCSDAQHRTHWVNH